MEINERVSMPLTKEQEADETKQKISDSHLGEKCYMFGKHLSDETKQKIRNAVLGDKNPNWKGGKKI